MNSQRPAGFRCKMLRKVHTTSNVQHYDHNQLGNSPNKYNV